MSVVLGTILAGPSPEYCQRDKELPFWYSAQNCREKGKAWNVALRRLTRKVVPLHPAGVSTD